MASHVRMVFVVPGDLIAAWEAARSRAIREGLELRPTKPEAVHNAQVLEVLIAEYLNGPEYPVDYHIPDSPDEPPPSVTNTLL